MVGADIDVEASGKSARWSTNSPSWSGRIARDREKSRG